MNGRYNDIDVDEARTPFIAYCDRSRRQLRLAQQMSV